jgi:hypothetical protein
MTGHSVTAREAANRIGLWTIVGFLLFVAGAIASLLAVALVEQLILDPMGIGPQAGEVSLSLRNSLHAVLWGIGVVAVAAPIGRRLVRDARFGLAGWVVLASGLSLAGLTTFLVDEFVRARYGYFDPEATGWTVFVGPALVATALAAWAALSVPAGRRNALIALTAAAAAGLGLLLLPSLPDVTDGIAARNVPISIAFVLDAGYAIGATAFTLAAGRPPG